MCIRDRSGRSLAVYIREAALAATVTARHTPEENALLRSLAGMANNLNLSLIHIFPEEWKISGAYICEVITVRLIQQYE